MACSKKQNNININTTFLSENYKKKMKTEYFINTTKTIVAISIVIAIR